MASFLITGIAGFIGSNLAESLAKEGHRVVGVDNFLTGKKDNLESFIDKIEFVEGDIRDSGLLDSVCDRIDYVLHHAALASVPWSVEDPVLAHEHNVTGTLNVLEAARKQKVKKVVMAVTSASYGENSSLPLREDLPVDNLSPYAATKFMGEVYLNLYQRLYDLPTIGLRYFNVYGKRQDPGSAYAAAIPIFIKKLLGGESPVIFGDGEQTRDFVFIEDVIQANIKACMAGPEASGKIFNIGSQKQITINELCKLIAEYCDSTISPAHVEKRAGEVLHSVADISRARKMLGYTPAYDIESGLAQTVKWYREQS